MNIALSGLHYYLPLRVQKPLYGKRAFFVAYGGAHIQMQIPVIRQLQAQGCECVVLALTTAQPVMRRLGMAYIGFADLVEPGDEEALALGKILSADLPTPPIDEAETRAYLGLSYRDLEWRLGKNEAAELYARKNRQGFEPVTVMTRALLKYAPDVVVVSSAPRAEKAAVIAARQLGIPAAIMIDLFGPSCPWAVDAHYADLLLVFSEITRDYLVAQGRPAEDIVVTGNPALDHLSDTVWQGRAKAFLEAQGWENNPVILWASNPQLPGHEALPEAVEAELLRLLQKHPEWRLVARFHPSERRRAIRSPQVYTSTGGEELAMLLHASDCCVTINSTVGLEAACIGKAVVSVDYAVTPHLKPLEALGISLSAGSMEAVEDCLMRALSAPPGRSFRIRAHAGREVSEAISGMLGGVPRRSWLQEACSA